LDVKGSVKNRSAREIRERRNVYLKLSECTRKELSLIAIKVSSSSPVQMLIRGSPTYCKDDEVRPDVNSISDASSCLSGLLIGGKDCSRVLLIVPLGTLSRTVSTKCDR